MSYLQVADGSVSTQDECDGRDAQGYPRTARRRLEQNHDDAGTVTDIDTGQRFKVQKTKGGDRIVPLFDKQVYWKSESGYDALRLCLSCLGASDEYVLWDETTGAEMTREEWCKRKFLAKSTPPIRHMCGRINSTTWINTVRSGIRPGCPCTSVKLNPWSERYTEFVSMLREGYVLELTENDWREQCIGNKFCPPIRCITHGTITTTTSIDAIQRGCGVGCLQCVPNLNHWSNRYSECVSLLRTGFTLELTEDEWKTQCTGAHWCPPIRCNKHGTTSTTTPVSSIQQGCGIGCVQCVPALQPWSGRYGEFVALLPEGYTLQLSEEEWKVQCTGFGWCPPIRCNTHGITTTSTDINHIQQKRGIGCPQCVPQINPWSNRYTEFVKMVPSGYTLKLSEDEWKQRCDGNTFCPPIRCNKHGIVTTTTSICNIQQKNGVGCPRCVPLLARKSEATVLKWLESAFPTATIAREVPGPEKTRFDFVLTFGNDHIVLEVDGSQHFWKDYFVYNARIPQRDAEKARWALARGQWVVRVLANDVFWDRNGWRAWLRRAIDEARAGAATTGAAPRVLTPDAPEYRSPESAYIDPHTNDTNA